MHYDIAIIGAGIIGSSIAYQLSKEIKQKIIVFEQSNLPTPEKSSFGYSRITGRATGSECDEYFNLLPISNKIYKELLKYNNLIYSPGNCITFGQNECDLLETIKKQINEYDISSKVINHPTQGEILDPFFRKLHTSDVIIKEKCTVDNMLGVLNPTEVVYTFQNLSQLNGSEFYFGCEITNIEKNLEGSMITVLQDGVEQKYKTKKLILATNSNLIYYKKLSNIVTRQRVPLIFIPIKNKNFVDSYLQVTKQDKYEMYVMPDKNKNGLFLKAGFHDLSLYEDITLTDDEFMQKMKPIIMERVIEYFPFVQDCQISHTAMCEYAITPDGLPLIGITESDIWIAAGFNGTGCKHAGAFGKIVADMVLNKNIKQKMLYKFNPLRFGII